VQTIASIQRSSQQGGQVLSRTEPFLKREIQKNIKEVSIFKKDRRNFREHVLDRIEPRGGSLSGQKGKTV